MTGHMFMCISSELPGKGKWTFHSVSHMFTAILDSLFTYELTCHILTLQRHQLIKKPYIWAKTTTSTGARIRWGVRAGIRTVTTWTQVCAYSFLLHLFPQRTLSSLHTIRECDTVMKIKNRGRRWIKKEWGKKAIIKNEVLKVPTSGHKGSCGHSPEAPVTKNILLIALPWVRQYSGLGCCRPSC